MKRRLIKISFIFSLILIFAIPVFAQTTQINPVQEGQAPQPNSTDEKQVEAKSTVNFYFGNNENVTPNYICARADLSSADCWDMYRKWEARPKGMGLYIEASYPSIFSLYREVEIWQYL